MKYKLGIYIGRFQPFHAGHLETVKIMLNECETILLSVGSHNRPKTIKNPWTSNERVEIIKKALVEEFNPDLSGKWEDYPERTILDRIKFQTVRDYMYNDNKWAAETYSKALLNGATDDKNTCLFGHFKDDSSYYLNMYPQWDLHTVPNFFDIDATQFRTQLFESKTITEEMAKLVKRTTLLGMKAWIHTEEGKHLQGEYEYTQKYQKMLSEFPYPINIVCSDAIVIKSGHILLIKRGFNPGKGLWALPGGHLNLDETQQQCAIRELKEETKIDVPKVILNNSIADSEDFQHPKRSLRGRVMTKAFLIDLGVGPLPKVKGSDDAVRARWIPLADFHCMEAEMFEDHYDIIVQMTSKY
jgi:bifunctional NMN adenylyltransferase/nudix hydrolase